MSIAEVERFAADLKSNAALRAAAGKGQGDNQDDKPIARAVVFAKATATAEIYALSLHDAHAIVKAKAKAAGKELTDAELDGVVGGVDPNGCAHTGRCID